jgi:hypothetical protein
MHPPEGHVTFAWAYLDEAGQDLGSSDEFADREAAESWMGDSWQDLLERGVEEVALVDRERDRTVYRMGLRAEA